MGIKSEILGELTMKEKERKFRKSMFEEGNFDYWLSDQRKKVPEDNIKYEILNLDQAKKELNKIYKNLDCLSQNYVKYFKQHLKFIRRYYIKDHGMPKDIIFGYVSNLSAVIKKLKENKNESNKYN